MTISTSMLAEFRRKIQDTRYSRRVMTVSVSDETVSTATLEITAGRLTTSIIGGSAAEVSVLLTSSAYDTVEKLFQLFSRTGGYSVQMDEDVSREHLSIDIEPVGLSSIKGTGIDLVTHLFSDAELEEILKNAVLRHNPGMSIDNLPEQERVFVFPLAQANVARIQAQDAAKRKGLDSSVSDLIALADSFENQYREDSRRHSRVIQPAREANPNLVAEGDVVLGKLQRRSLRTGFQAPISQTIDPDPPVLLVPDEHMIEDDNVQVVWQRNRNVDFYSYELWMDTRPDVVRSHAGELAFGGATSTFPNTPTGQGFLSDGAGRQTTSKMVFRAFGSESRTSRGSFAVSVQEFGQLLRSFAVPELESDTEYFFRLYVSTINYTVSGSNIVSALTKAQRARFMPLGRSATRPGPIGGFANKTSGPAGTVVEITLDPTAGPYTTAHTFTVGGKVVTPVIHSAYAMEITIPAFQTKDAKDFVIISPTQLVDVRPCAFTVTP